MLRTQYSLRLCVVLVQITRGILSSRKLVANCSSTNEITPNLVSIRFYCARTSIDEDDNILFACLLDLLTVNETAIEPPQEDPTGLNSPKNLSLEATFINHNFSQQVLKSVSYYSFILTYFVNELDNLII